MRLCLKMGCDYCIRLENIHKIKIQNGHPIYNNHTSGVASQSSCWGTWRSRKTVSCRGLERMGCDYCIRLENIHKIKIQNSHPIYNNHTSGVASQSSCWGTWRSKKTVSCRGLERMGCDYCIRLENIHKIKIQNSHPIYNNHTSGVASQSSCWGAWRSKKTVSCRGLEREAKKQAIITRF